jgi:hypothetical protein
MDMTKLIVAFCSFVKAPKKVKGREFCIILHVICWHVVAVDCKQVEMIISIFGSFLQNEFTVVTL